MVLLITYLYMHFVFTGMGEEHYTQTIWEILIDRQFFAHFVRSRVTELMEGCLEDEAA